MGGSPPRAAAAVAGAADHDGHLLWPWHRGGSCQRCRLPGQSISQLGANLLGRPAWLYQTRPLHFWCNSRRHRCLAFTRACRTHTHHPTQLLMMLPYNDPQRRTRRYPTWSMTARPPSPPPPSTWCSWAAPPRSPARTWPARWSRYGQGTQAPRRPAASPTCTYRRPASRCPPQTGEQAHRLQVFVSVLSALLVDDEWYYQVAGRYLMRANCCLLVAAA